MKHNSLDYIHGHPGPVILDPGKLYCVKCFEEYDACACEKWPTEVELERAWKALPWYRKLLVIVRRWTRREA